MIDVQERPDFQHALICLSQSQQNLEESQDLAMFVEQHAPGEARVFIVRHIQLVELDAQLQNQVHLLIEPLPPVAGLLLKPLLRYLKRAKQERRLRYLVQNTQVLADQTANLLAETQQASAKYTKHSVDTSEVDSLQVIDASLLLEDINLETISVASLDSFHTAFDMSSVGAILTPDDGQDLDSSACDTEQDRFVPSANTALPESIVSGPTAHTEMLATDSANEQTSRGRKKPTTKFALPTLVGGLFKQSFKKRQVTWDGRVWYSDTESLCELRAKTSKGPPQDDVSFDEENVIGHGGFSKVYRVKWRRSYAAAKRYLDQPSKETREAFMREVRMWSELKHPNVVTFYDARIAGENLYIIGEYCTAGSISKYLHKNPSADALRIPFARDISAGLAFLHEKDVVHADLKAANILVADHNPPRAVLSDFGLSAKSSEIHKNGSAGTFLWRAPELLSGKQRYPDSVTDVYSLGLTMWEIFSGRLPYEFFGSEVLIQTVVEKDVRPARPACLPEEHIVWQTIQECWASDREERLTASQAENRVKLVLESEGAGTSTSTAPTEP